MVRRDLCDPMALSIISDAQHHLAIQDSLTIMDSEHLSKSPVFPAEIIELIIDHLQDDIVALTRISGTSHAILHSCRRHLFRSVKLGISPTPYIFIRLFQYNPSIGQYVRELELDIDSFPSWIPGKPNTSAENVQTLTQTPFVEKLAIRGSISPPTSWDSLRANLQQPILNHIHSASLTELSIYNFVIPVTIFRSCVNLSALTISQVKDSGKTELLDQERMSPCSPQPMNIPQLRSLELGKSSYAFALALVRYRDSDGHPLIRFDGLKTLIVRCHREKETQVIEDICKEAIGLETFACRGISWSTVPFFTTHWPDLSRFSTLKTLKGWCRDLLPAGDLLQGLCEGLQRFPLPNVLETLDIEILMSVNWHSKSISTQNTWSQLDAVLSHRFPQLHKVSINVVFPYHPENPDLESAELCEEVGMVRKRFPWLNGNEAVKFDFATSFAVQEGGIALDIFLSPL